ncbi:MAG: type II secretion system protein [Patescibacteria group bacterium]
MRNRGGFTIVETLMVLAVTSIIFVAVIGSVTDRQNRIQFSQGMRDINSNISDVLNDVTTGFFPTTPGLTCTAGSNNNPPQLGYNASTGDTTGARKDCVFAGKVIQIGTDTSASLGFVYSMAGRRLTANSNDVANFAELQPVVIDSKNTDNVTISAGISNIDATGGLSLPYGIRIVRSDGSDGGRAIGVFYKDFRGVSLNGQSSSGITQVAIADVFSATSGPSSMTQTNVIAAADNTTALSSKFLSGSSTITLCFKGDTTGQTATITIGDGIQGNLRLDYEVDLSGVVCD